MTYKLTKENIKKIVGKIAKPFENPVAFFNLLIVKIDQQTQLTFRGQGARDIEPAWPTWNKGKGFNVLGGTTLTEAGTRKIRYGTDLSGAGFHSKGPYPGYVRKGVRRYTGTSKLLQASGTFRKSFGKLGRASKNRVKYGTQFPLAEKIMSNPTRQVLFITENDRKQYADLFYRYVFEAMKV